MTREEIDKACLGKVLKLTERNFVKSKKAHKESLFLISGIEMVCYGNANNSLYFRIFGYPLTEDSNSISLIAFLSLNEINKMLTGESIERSRHDETYVFVF